MIQSRKHNIGVILIPDIQESYDGKETIVLPQKKLTYGTKENN